LSSGASDVRRLSDRVLDLYATTTLLMLLGIAVLVVYILRLGPLTSPGAQTSFGYAIALMSLMGAVLFHVLDRTYRSWPLGRRFRPTDPGAVSVATQVRFVKIVVVVLTAAALAYLIGGLFV
jgi:hypothetical protein